MKKHNFFILEMLALVLALGFALVSCDNDTTDDSIQLYADAAGTILYSGADITEITGEWWTMDSAYPAPRVNKGSTGKIGSVTGGKLTLTLPVPSNEKFGTYNFSSGAQIAFLYLSGDIHAYDADGNMLEIGYLTEDTPNIDGSPAKKGLNFLNRNGRLHLTAAHHWALVP